MKIRRQQIPNVIDGFGATTLLSTVKETAVERGRGRFRRTFDGVAMVKDSRSPKSPDRFIPLREFIDPPSTPLRVGKPTQTLTPEERLLRQRIPRSDPFMPERPRRSASIPRIQSGRTFSPHYIPHLISGSAIRSGSEFGPRDPLRQVSAGAVWSVGGTSAMLGRQFIGVPGDTRGRLASRATAPVYTARFLSQAAPSEEPEKHEARVALALNIDPAVQILKCRLWSLLESKPSPSHPDYERFSTLIWKGSAWKRGEADQWRSVGANKDTESIVPARPFRILDAPYLRDDFYCTTLAYSPTSGVLAVGLAHRVYVWSEIFGVLYPPFADHHPSNFVNSLSFSSESGGKDILAVGRRSGLVTLWSAPEAEPRYEISHPNSITSVAFRQTVTRRFSERFHNVEVNTEDLAVGDELGNIWYYSVEWPSEEIREQFGWNGAITLLARISAHTQRICGITWSPDGAYLATGGNDNACLIFELRDLVPWLQLNCATKPCKSAQTCQSISVQCQNAFSSLSASTSKRLFRRRDFLNLLPSWSHFRLGSSQTSLIKHTESIALGTERTVIIPPNRQKHILAHAAAVKAIAFAPWQPSLLATGGGSNDRAIHFWHAPSGACLASINVYAQVTGLIWSKRRREIVATFGFAQPEHPYRIAVFAWPSCEQIAAIPWGPYGTSWDGMNSAGAVHCGRAICAVSYPGKSHALMHDLLDCATSISSSTSTIQRRRRQSEPYRRTAHPIQLRPSAKEGGLWCPRTLDEGCIIVASSDQTVKFHEVWSGPKKSTAAACGLFGGSQILEGLEGLEKPGDEIIR
ncbi:hypothetical protein KXV68_009668 [Aspergillus fumigatus]|nr:hypothetical protein CNMCM8714_004478 [Aspergillus fumigatus]KAF4274635.1 hypothetical protein CNMCM8812_004667 [Aspergillus fumigatus]KAH1307257.1 hypothetical protein KXX11_003659 [Aspergillus fumigatus]KAH1339285.1 hypothetical protein KXX67_009197 [Aspergillus fumigatus]KAH1458735.1 hypothetical protein KXX13_008570 [Aspergillus fumigatus]